MKLRFSAVVALLTLVGCATSVPDSNPNSGGGVGFEDYDRYAAARAGRDAQLARRKSEPMSEELAIAQDTIGVLNETAPQSSLDQGVVVAGTVSAPADNPGISDEQSFDAVSSRETIESDRERLQRQSEEFQVAQPEAVPDRPAGRAAPNIVAYALETNNRVGQQVYRRGKRFNEDRYRRACAEFGSSDQAQAAFLAAGGPERDRRGLDPDGDGFACFWDPTPFRTAQG